MQRHQAAAVTLVAALLLAAPAGRASRSLHAEPVAGEEEGGAYSALWGEGGEDWSPAGLLMDWSYAGYRNGNDPLPTPPVTKWVTDFAQPGGSDQAMLQVALDWAHAQPLTEDYIVLGLPEGRVTVERVLKFERPRLILRGAGKGRSTLFIPQSLTDVYGPAKHMGTGGYIFEGGWLAVRGNFREGGKHLALVVGTAMRGARELQVDSTARLEVGQKVQLAWSGTPDGALANYMLQDRIVPTEKIKNHHEPIRFSSRIVEVLKNSIVLERALPLEVRPEFTPTLYPHNPNVTEVGIEDLTIEFPQTVYKGHHLESGFNAIELYGVADCWIKNVELINVDNGVLSLHVNAITITELSITTKRGSRYGQERFDGHWGVHSAHGTDLLVEKFYIAPNLYHCVGADAFSAFNAYSNGTLADCNLEQHRLLTSNNLFTQIDVGGLSRVALFSGGPEQSGPPAGLGSAFWNIWGQNGSLTPPYHSYDHNPGTCTYAPTLAMVGVKLSGPPCAAWWHEPDARLPANLYLAQQERRARGAAASGGSAAADRGGSTSSGGSPEGWFTQVTHVLSRMMHPWAQ